MNQPKVTTVIPGFNLGPKSLSMMDQCLQSVYAQDYDNKSVVVTDHSLDDEIQEHIKDFGWLDKLDIVYVRFNGPRGFGVANLNNGFDHVDEDAIIAPMNQDDYYCSEEAFSKVVKALQDSGAHWAAMGCRHVDENYVDLRRDHPPRWLNTLDMALGQNFIGCMSVVMIRQCPLRQDDHLTYLNDCEYYYRLGQQYGAPVLVNDLLVAVMDRPGGVSNTMDVPTIKFREQQYVQKKHSTI